MSSEKMIDSSYVPFPNPDVILHEEEIGSAVLVNLDTGNAISLNFVGRFIWETVDGNTSVEEIIDRIKQNFLSVPADVSDEVIKLIHILKSNGFFGYVIKHDQF